MLIAGQHSCSRFSTPASDARKAIGRIADEGQPIGNGGWPHAELFQHTRLVIHDVSTAIPTDHLSRCIRDQLGQVFVWRANYDLLDTRLVAEAHSSSGNRIVGFKFNHRPNHDAQRSNRLLSQRKLSQERRVNTFAALVARIQIVAEGGDDVIERARDMRRARLRDQRQQAAEQAKRRADLAAIRRFFGRRTIKAAEQFVGAVYQVNFHIWKHCRNAVTALVARGNFDTAFVHRTVAAIGAVGRTITRLSRS